MSRRAKGNEPPSKSPRGEAQKFMNHNIKLFSRLENIFSRFDYIFSSFGYKFSRLENNFYARCVKFLGVMRKKMGHGLRNFVSNSKAAKSRLLWHARATSGISVVFSYQKLS